jgi:hypothetical protein
MHAVVKEFEPRITIVYHRFDKNMGGSDLVGHWHRCIGLTRGEPWIWLFSDDDIMEENCVDLFYKALESRNEEELFHFNVKIINEKGDTTGKFQPFPERLSAAEYFYKRITYALSSFVVEYIFSRRVYERENGFEKFDLAWGSDDATWMKFGKEKGIFTIAGAFVQWRFSQINISSKVEDRKTILRKLDASEAYLKWARLFFVSNRLVDQTSSFEKLKWMLQQFLQTSALSFKEKIKLVNGLVSNLNYRDIRLKALLYVTYMELKKRKNQFQTKGLEKR